MCAIYGLICKHEKKNFGKKILNVTNVSYFSIKIQRFVTCHYLEMAPKIHNNSKFSKEQKKFANWAVGGAQYAFHEKWLQN